eukprot:CAMPEP_0202950118 /NCGR_PEP_ID=MMETSP1395-20130829/19317_1 /ASSEMBLY_ACC=CAM_ASM_000871 /TAXON_ID=5961 /ORGANISM="Blepharisma japonicum, Strain Stock R1072" /LENGTH=74 /DNA_ID=CAMNT_0049653935 /DNA_START=220 /DNA_END=441 /DNA_ORIENTATION=+
MIIQKKIKNLNSEDMSRVKVKPEESRPKDDNDYSLKVDKKEEKEEKDEKSEKDEKEESDMDMDIDEDELEDIVN